MKRQLENSRFPSNQRKGSDTFSRIMMNVGNPETAFAFGQLPNEGIGLARLEFVAWLGFGPPVGWRI